MEKINECHHQRGGPRPHVKEMSNRNIAQAQGYRLLRVWYRDYEWDHDAALPVLAFGLEEPDQVPTVFTPTGETFVDELADSHLPAKSILEEMIRQEGLRANALICPNGIVVDLDGFDHDSVEGYIRGLQNRELGFGIRAARKRVGIAA